MSKPADRRDPQDPETEVDAADDDGAALFDASTVRIESKALTVDQLVKRLKQKSIDLVPEVQASAGLFDPAAESRLIESILVRVPLPAFYFDASDDDNWLVIDGLRRLVTLKRFVLDGRLKLAGLDYHDGLEGKRFKDLPRHFQRRILEAPVTAHLLREGAQAAVKFDIFRRLNTGGMPLRPQEIRYALAQGQATRFLKLLADDKAFRAALGDGALEGGGMADQALVLRFLAFRLTPPAAWHGDDRERFLSDAMQRLADSDRKTLKQLRDDFGRALRAANRVFDATAFRRPSGTFEAALFEAWTVALAGLDDGQIKALADRAAALKEEFRKLIDSDTAFARSVSGDAGDRQHTAQRFEAIEKLIRGQLE